jgi:signal transduction histidine kinase
LLETDARRLRQVLINLAGNAVKFTGKGTVMITAQQEGTSVMIIVEDTGPGIRPDEMAGLFQPFHQLDMSSTKRHEGTGLGLYLSRKIMALLGGTLRAESEPGVGSRFIVEIPVAAGKGASA